jgi:hypothetical protein
MRWGATKSLPSGLSNLETADLIAREVPSEYVATNSAFQDLCFLNKILFQVVKHISRAATNEVLRLPDRNKMRC